MIEYLRSTRYRPAIKKRESLQPGSWIRVEKPTEEEINLLAADMALDEELIRDALDPHEVPRVEVDDDELYFITRRPDTDESFNAFTTPILLVLDI